MGNRLGNRSKRLGLEEDLAALLCETCHGVGARCVESDEMRRRNGTSPTKTLYRVGWAH